MRREPPQFAVDFLLYRFRQRCLRELFAQFENFFAAAAFFAQRLFDGALLLTQQMFALLSVDVVLRGVGDFAADFVHGFLCTRMSCTFSINASVVSRSENFLLLLDVEIRRKRRDAVHLHDRVGDRADQLMKNLQAVLSVEQLRDGAGEFQVLAHSASTRGCVGIVFVDGRFGSGRNALRGADRCSVRARTRTR